MRKLIQPDGKVIEVVTIEPDKKEYVLPINIEEHPAWSKSNIGHLGSKEKQQARTQNTGNNIFLKIPDKK